jgi:putative SOS response-associated peptidase YedK
MFGFDRLPNLPPRWNIAPTQDVIAIRAEGGSRRSLAQLRWGLIPAWAKDAQSGPPLINARGETVREKPSFQDAFRSTRCLIPADGFYEWSGKGKEKRAFFIKPKGPIAFAGIASRWRGPEGRIIDSCAIVTTEAGGPLAAIHHRSPVVINTDDFDLWLSQPPDQAASLIRTPADDVFSPIEVDSRVGDVRQDDKGLIAPKTATPPPISDQMLLL